MMLESSQILSLVFLASLSTTLQNSKSFAKWSDRHISGAAGISGYQILKLTPFSSRRFLQVIYPYDL
jgi:hypothetical protein